LTAWQRATVLDTVDKQLQYQPEVKTKNRKPLRPNLLAPWELRIDSLRVYYSVDESNLLVYIHAIGIKKRNQVWIGKEVIDL
jgi:mRNA-degrading endonuclease RelE of RelBE toxin-antitoxin system